MNALSTAILYLTGIGFLGFGAAAALRARGSVHWGIWFALALEVAGVGLNLWGLQRVD